MQMKNDEVLRFPHKAIRAQAIKKYMEQAGYTRAVCFSCGNAARELEAAGVDVLHIGEHGELAPRKWFSQAEIARDFAGYFDATSGNLPAELMGDIARRYREHLQDTLDDTVYVPTGSGETLVCLKMAYPDKHFVAVYNMDEATAYSEEAPLNELVALIADRVLFADTPV